jgi:hypothetical protein
MTPYEVTVYVNVGEHNFDGYTPKAPIAEVDTFTIEAEDAEWAANGMWPVGNKMQPDAQGKSYPRDVRSLSVGDLLKVSVAGGKHFFAIESVGFTEIPEPANPIVALAGTRATSRATATIEEQT